MISCANRGMAGAGLLAFALGAVVCGTAPANAGDRGGGLNHAVQEGESAGFSHVRGFDGDRGRFGAYGSPGLVPVHGFRGRSRIGGSFVFIAPGPFYDPFFYPGAPPYYGYYPPPVVTVPPVYVERPLQAVPNPSGYWYWCSAPVGYYPTVTTCPGGWQAVLPQPPSR